MRFPKVVHCKRDKFDIYIGRPSIYGNPWSHKADSQAEFIVPTREIAVINFERWLKGEIFQNVLLEKRKAILESLPQLENKDLGCWCVPLLCHGYPLVRLANPRLIF